MISLGSREIGAGRPCYVIAEAGVNHNGDLDLARALVDAAAAAGADAVKFQTFAAERLVAVSAPTAPYQQRAGAGDDQAAMLRELELAPEHLGALRRRAQEAGIELLSSPFDEHSIDVLVGLGVPAIKLGSGELTNVLLLRHVAEAGLPVLLSTGMATLDEVERAIDELDAVRDVVVLLHCVSAYPADPAGANLRAMATMAEAFGVPVGYSDHTLGTSVALAAVAMGAVVLEKHLTLDRSLPGPDHAASLEPSEMAALVRDVRSVEAALGDGIKRPVDAELEVAAVARRSLFAARDLPAGHVLVSGDLVALRPASGVPPTEIDRLVGRPLTRALVAGEPIALDGVS